MLDTSKIYTSNNCGDFKVIEYNGALNVTVEFISTGTRKIKQASDIVKGLVKDEFYPSVYGVGFIGVGEYRPRDNRKQYEVWSGMFRRCYSEKSHKKHPSYIGCSVDPAWHDFQNFAKWFDENYIEGYDLDKDIKVNGNKTYGPKTCLFVSKSDNAVKANAKTYKMVSPCGGVVDIYNMSEFCRGAGLCRRNMNSVANGERRSHKGWTKAPD